MRDADLQRIAHIKVYCEDIAETIARFGDDFAQFERDKDFYKSVSMSIMQIGELSGGLSDGFKDSTRAQIPWGLIRGMRNLFAHVYTDMEKAMVWETASKDIPMLLKFCNGVLDQR